MKILPFWIACLFVTYINCLMAQDFRENNFFIKEGYIARSKYTHFDDTGMQDQNQDEVYLAAYQLADKHQYTNIGDIGCGSGFKLLKYFGESNTVGFEIQPTLNFLRKKYPSKNWQPSNFSKSPLQTNFDVLICSDVIEHLVNPDQLLNWINQFNFKYLVISTPDRDRLGNVWTDKAYERQLMTGPPVNIAHIREWNFEEFEKYINQYFNIVEHFHCQKEFYGQVIIATKKSISN